MLYYLLDREDAELNSLDPKRRLWLFYNIWGHSKQITRVFNNSNTPIQKLQHDAPIQELRSNATIQEILRNTSSSHVIYEDSSHINELRHALHELVDYNIMNGEIIPLDLQRALSEAIELCRSTDELSVVNEYEVTSIHDLLFLEVIRMFENGEMIAKCKNCGKYFVPKNRKVVYCDRMTDKGKTCSDIGATLAYQKSKRTIKFFKCITALIRGILQDALIIKKTKTKKSLKIGMKKRQKSFRMQEMEN